MESTKDFNFLGNIYFFKKLKEKLDFVSIIADNIQDIQINIFGKIRASGNKSPILVFGIISESLLLENPLAKFFKDRPTEYAYIEFPINLYKFLQKIQRMKPLRDELAVKRHIIRYADKDGILNVYIHDLNNATNNRNSEEIRDILSKSKKMFSEQDDLYRMIEELEKLDEDSLFVRIKEFVKSRGY